MKKGNEKSKEKDLEKKQYLEKWRQHHDYKVAEEKINQFVAEMPKKDSLGKRVLRTRKKARDYDERGMEFFQLAAQIYASLGDYRSAVKSLEKERKQYMIKVNNAGWIVGRHEENSPPSDVLKIDSYIDALEKLQSSDHKRKPKREDSDLESFIGVFIGGIFLLASIFLSLNTITGFSIAETIPKSTNNYLAIIFFIIGIAVSLIFLKKKK